MTKVLLIDDSPFTLRIHADLIKEIGLEPLMANNGEEAIALFEEHRPEIVLCDIMMPEMDGYEVLAALKDREPRLFFQFVSGELTEAIVRKATAAGAQGVVEKPLSLVPLTRVWEAFKTKGRS